MKVQGFSLNNEVFNLKQSPSFPQKLILVIDDGKHEKWPKYLEKPKTIFSQFSAN